MTVYVDDMEAAFGDMIMCHMWADTDDELLSMADKIGVERHWIQGHPTLSLEKYKKASWVHFDIAKSKRALAIKNGAKQTDKYGPVEHTARLKIKMGEEKGDCSMIEEGKRKLDQVAKSRGMFSF